MRKEFPLDGQFDLVLDKGTMDAMLCGATSVESSSRFLHECHRWIRMLLTIIIGQNKSLVLCCCISSDLAGFSDLAARWS